MYSGNSYSQEWKEEAARRGLLNLPTTVDALPHYADEKNVRIFEKLKVLSAGEINSRTEILLENYVNAVRIEALTALDMARREITPAVISYQSFLAEEIRLKKEFGAVACGYESKLLGKLAAVTEEFGERLEVLADETEKLESVDGNLNKAQFCKDVILPAMENLRKSADEAELLTGKRFCSLPDYEDILYSVKY